MKQFSKIKTLVVTLIAISFLTLASCTKNDDRDQFEGSYLVDGTGSITLLGVSQNFAIPFDASNEEMTLTKSTSNDTEMFASGFLDVKAIVFGNIIQFESFSETISDSESGITLQLLYDVKNGTLNGNVLTFKLDVTGSAYYQGSSVPVEGAISCIATKQ